MEKSAKYTMREDERVKRVRTKWKRRGPGRTEPTKVLNFFARQGANKDKVLTECATVEVCSVYGYSIPIYMYV